MFVSTEFSINHLDFTSVHPSGQLLAGTCEIVTLDRDSSQPRRTIARQTARCACRKGQIAGTTRARPACVDGEMKLLGLIKMIETNVVWGTSQEPGSCSLVDTQAADIKLTSECKSIRTYERKNIRAVERLDMRSCKYLNIRTSEHQSIRSSEHIKRRTSGEKNSGASERGPEQPCIRCLYQTETVEQRWTNTECDLICLDVSLTWTAS